jgi:hypothetical protein
MYALQVSHRSLLRDNRKLTSACECFCPFNSLMEFLIVSLIFILFPCIETGGWKGNSIHPFPRNDDQVNFTEPKPVLRVLNQTTLTWTE